jgi:hypothetical protein
MERRLYHAALEREPGEASDAFLEEACKGDEDLRRKLTLLLAEDASKVRSWIACVGSHFQPSEAATKTMCSKERISERTSLRPDWAPAVWGKCIAR